MKWDQKCHQAETEVACVHHTHTLLITSTLAIPPTPKKPSKYLKKVNICKGWDNSCDLSKSRNAPGQRELLKTKWPSQRVLESLASTARSLTPVLTHLQLLVSCFKDSRILQHQPSHLMLQNDGCLWPCLPCNTSYAVGLHLYVCVAANSWEQKVK